MTLVKRWYMETPEGEIVDGPYSDKKEFDRELALYTKQYKYTPVVVERMVDTRSFSAPVGRDSRGIETGRVRRRLKKPDVAA